MGYIEIVTEFGYWDGETGLPYDIYVYDEISHVDLDSAIEQEIKEAGGIIVIVKLQEKYS